jgi:hypothetical protein
MAHTCKAPKRGTCGYWRRSLVDKAIPHSHVNRSHIDPNVSLWDWFNDEIRARGFAPDQQDRLLQVVQDRSGFVGEDIRSQSLKTLWLETSLPGGQ